jgi:hypothetical protein
MFGSKEHLQAIQDGSGIDVAQIDQLLALSPTERLRTLEEFLEEDDALKRARDKFHAEASRAAGAVDGRGR